MWFNCIIMKSKKWLFFAVLVLFTIGLLAYFVKYKNRPELFSYDNLNNKVKEINPEIEIVVKPEELKNEQNTNFLIKNYIVRGYFENYDQQQKQIDIKAQLVNTNQYRIISSKITEKTIISCWPEYLYDTVKKIEIPTNKLTFMINSTDDLLKINQEKIVENFDFKTLTNYDYLIIQLDDPVSITDNKIKKLIILDSICSKDL